MGIGAYIREIGRGKDGARPLDRAQAADLFGQVLDGGLSDLEVGAFCLAMRIKGETAQEMAGFLDATHARMRAIPAGADGAPPTIVIPNLADTLWLEEGSGILTWAVEGVRCYRADLLKSGHFVLTNEQHQRVNRIIPPAPNTPNSDPTLPTKQLTSETNILWRWFNTFQGWLKRLA
ncbi:MAG: hypothetical protein EBS37_16990 [Betaproteobacteria bacterium]|nr:hypothetical protein [Betaproteobacteria bacterium]